LYESKAALLRMQIELLQAARAATLRKVQELQELQQQWGPDVTPADTLVPMMHRSPSSGTGSSLLGATGMTPVPGAPHVKGEGLFGTACPQATTRLVEAMPLLQRALGVRHQGQQCSCQGCCRTQSYAVPTAAACRGRLGWGSRGQSLCHSCLSSAAAGAAA
jgi:hypothetical protein